MFRLLATLALKLGRFRVEGQFPDIPSYVIVFANHTSHWDTFWTLVATRYAGFGKMVRWMYAEKLDQGLSRVLFAPLLRYFGGFSIDRESSKQERVEVIAEGLRNGTFRVFGIAPEGKRRWGEHWKSGFYFVARNAEIPLFLLIVDYATRAIHLGPLVHLTGDVTKDMDQLRTHCSQFTAKFPDNVGPVRLREEVQSCNSVETYGDDVR